MVFFSGLGRKSFENVKVLFLTAGKCGFLYVR